MCDFIFLFLQNDNIRFPWHHLFLYSITKDIQFYRIQPSSVCIAHAEILFIIVHDDYFLNFYQFDYKDLQLLRIKIFMKIHEIF